MTLYDYWTKIHIACGVGVFLGRVNVKKLEAIQPAMFTEDKGSDEKGAHPLDTNLFLSPACRCH